MYNVCILNKDDLTCQEELIAFAHFGNDILHQDVICGDKVNQVPHRFSFAARISKK